MFQAEDGIRDWRPSRGLGDGFKRQTLQEELNSLIYQMAARGALQAQDLLGSITNDVLGTMTDQQINRLVYDKAEPDLLWIRMNGSIVGASIGLVVFVGMQFV